ncbi:MAG TPA: pitrilysin family protein [Vicinamibacterales bacterium]|nr:pitrilysin family protein [Vicinamibacterales bacterium]
MSRTVATGLAPARTVLSNGLVVLAKEATITPAVTINLAVRAGSVGDPAEAPGTAYFLSRVVDRGTAAHPAAEIADALDRRGISLAVNVTRHLLTMACTCLAEDFEAVLALVGEMAMAPVFPEREVETRRGEIVTAIRQDEDNPAVVAMEGLMGLLYPGGHPYGRPAKGTPASVAQIGRAEIAAFHEAWFAPARASLVVVGDVPPGRAAELAARVFDGWRGTTRADVPLVSPPPATGRRRVVVPMMNKAQADIAYGFTTIARNDPAYYAFLVMNNVLGQYALGGRLGESIREKQGMAYYVFSAFDPNVIAGPLLVRAGVNPSNVDRAVASIDREIDAMAASGATPREVAESKQFLIGSLPRTLETAAGIATFLQMAEYFGLGLDYDARLPELVRAVSAEQVHDAARRSLAADRAAVVIAGPYQDPACPAQA